MNSSDQLMSPNYYPPNPGYIGNYFGKQKLTPEFYPQK